MTLFEKIITHVLQMEGGYTNHEDDPGGKTNWGITESEAREHGYEGDMKDLPKNTALDIYKSDYWEGPKFDKVGEISPVIAYEVTDFGINAGVRQASRYLQRMINIFSRRGELYDKISTDGYVGPETLSGLRNYFDVRDRKGERNLFVALDSLQVNYYITLAESDEQYASFVYGWINQRSTSYAKAKEIVQ